MSSELVLENEVRLTQLYGKILSWEGCNCHQNVLLPLITVVAADMCSVHWLFRVKLQWTRAS